MSAGAVLDAAYALLAREADADDTNRRLFATENVDETETRRYQLDALLGLHDDDDADFDGTTNVIELAAWVNRVNATMV